ncbi:MAG: SIMPL domain-containing protein [Flavobacterium sp.]|nr:SIMPL domain-containing protein [Flavobacterium sp.]
MKDMISSFKKYFLKTTDIQKTKSYSILVYDATQTTKVFIGLEEIGLSNVNIEKTEHSEFDKIQLSVNSKAIKNAKVTADSYLNPLGQKTGKVIFIGNIQSTNMVAGRVSGIQIRGASSFKKAMKIKDIFHLLNSKN